MYVQNFLQNLTVKKFWKLFLLQLPKLSSKIKCLVFHLGTV